MYGITIVSIVCHLILQKDYSGGSSYVLSDCAERKQSLYAVHACRYMLCPLCCKHLFVYMYMCDVCGHGSSVCTCVGEVLAGGICGCA